MIDVHIAGGDTHLAELIASTLHGHLIPDPGSTPAEAGRVVRHAQEAHESRRPSREQIQTMNFALIDDESDWSDL